MNRLQDRGVDLSTVECDYYDFVDPENPRKTQMFLRRGDVLFEELEAQGKCS